MNHHRQPPISFSSLIFSLFSGGDLIFQMVKREVIGRYRGSIMGLFWSFLSPVMLLAVYTLVFSGIFKTSWSTNSGESTTQFAMILFIGMIIHSLFSETLTNAPLIILRNINYVKKMIFPLEILPVVTVGSSLFHAIVSIFVLLIALFVVKGSLPWTVIFLPLIILPFVLLTLGLAWILSSLGVFLRDIVQPIGLSMTILLFASPVFYPVTAFPESMRPWLILNPLTFIIDQSRNVVIYGAIPNLFGLLLYSFVSICIFWIGYIWFQKTRRGFPGAL